ncbi:hypothetical protein CPCC7001_2198 [Cyanobium sp. PCC 7001]|nr:hypothetical protein CPCC7001_2198 [Cyanobium sp. PCC 7001]
MPWLLGVLTSFTPVPSRQSEVPSSDLRSGSHHVASLDSAASPLHAQKFPSARSTCCAESCGKSFAFSSSASARNFYCFAEAFA